MASKAFIQNFALFKLDGDIPQKDALEASLAGSRFSPCLETSIDPSYGWAPAIHDDGGELVHNEMGVYLLCFKEQQKKVPKRFINEELKKEVNAFIKKTGNKPTREEKQSLQDKIVITAAKRSFPVNTRVLIWIDVDAKVMAIGSTSSTLIETAIGFLRAANFSLSSLFGDELENGKIMTSWLYDNNLPPCFALDTDGESTFKALTESGCHAKFKSEDITSDEVHQVIELNNKHAFALPLIWNELIKFKLDWSGNITSMKYTDEIENEVADASGSDEGEDSDNPLIGAIADLCLFTGKLRELLEELMAIFPVTEEGA